MAIKAKFHMGQQVKGGRCKRAGSMRVDNQNIGKVGHVCGVHLLTGDTEYHYAIKYTNGDVDYADESCVCLA